MELGYFWKPISSRSGPAASFGFSWAVSGCRISSRGCEPGSLGVIFSPNLEWAAAGDYRGGISWWEWIPPKPAWLGGIRGADGAGDLGAEDEVSLGTMCKIHLKWRQARGPDLRIWALDEHVEDSASVGGRSAGNSFGFILLQWAAERRDFLGFALCFP